MDELGMFIGRRKRMEGNEVLAKNRLEAIERWGYHLGYHLQHKLDVFLLHCCFLFNCVSLFFGINVAIHTKLRITRQVANVQNLVPSCSCLATPFLS